MNLVLASSSPRRKDLLARLEIPFEVVPSELPERSPAPDEPAHEYALALARSKVAEVIGRRPYGVVIGGDTVVVVDGLILGKPGDAVRARWMLERLRGRTHSVVTAVVVSGDTTCEGTIEARVRMRAVTDTEVEAYVGTGEPLDKAGGYALQGRGGRLIEEVRGCRNAVLGLPLCLSEVLLRAAHVNLPLPARDVCGCRDH